MTKQTFQAAEQLDEQMKLAHFDISVLERNMIHAADDQEPEYVERLAVKRAELEVLKKQFEEL